MSIEQERVPKLNKTSSQHPVSLTDNSQTDNIPSFLLKTYEILENGKYSDIISWTRSGEGFIVKKVKEFSQTVLPVYFRHNNYTSFVRQLNMYDFHKTRQENQQNAFKNFLFKKGHKYLLKEIQRKDYKKNKETNKQLYSIMDKQKFIESAEGGQSINKSNQEIVVTSPQNQCFRTNITELKKTKQQLEEKSLKLMAFKQSDFSTQMLMKAIDILFECDVICKKAFCQGEILRTDYELNERKKYISGFRETNKDEDKKEIYTSEKIQTKHSLSGFKEPMTQARTVLFPTPEPKQSQMLDSTELLIQQFQSLLNWRVQNLGRNKDLSKVIVCPNQLIIL